MLRTGLQIPSGRKIGGLIGFCLIPANLAVEKLKFVNHLNDKLILLVCQCPGHVPHRVPFQHSYALQIVNTPLRYPQNQALRQSARTPTSPPDPQHGNTGRHG